MEINNRTVIIPPKKILTAFEEEITPLIYQILNNLIENRT
jgi:hypothetical protein